MDEQVSRTGLSDALERILREVEGGAAGERAPTADDRPPPSPPPAEGGDTPLDDTLSSAAGAGGVPPEGATPLGALLGGVMSNPALLTALPTLMENLGPLLGGGAGRGGGGKGDGGRRPSHSTDRHTALICAVKPYLSGERQEAAEKIIRLCRAWEALQRSGVTDALRGLSPAAHREVGDRKTEGKGVGDYVQ